MQKISANVYVEILRHYKVKKSLIVTYAAPAWYPHTSKTTRKALEAFQNRTLRQLTNTPWFVRNTVVLRSAGLPSLHDFITGQARAMYAAAAESKWDHIREWATREAVHPWKIPQLKPLLGLDVLMISSHSACCRDATTEGTIVPAYQLPACLKYSKFLLHIALENSSNFPRLKCGCENNDVSQLIDELWMWGIITRSNDWWRVASESLSNTRNYELATPVFESPFKLHTRDTRLPAAINQLPSRSSGKIHIKISGDNNVAAVLAEIRSNLSATSIKVSIPPSGDRYKHKITNLNPGHGIADTAFSKLRAARNGIPYEDTDTSKRRNCTKDIYERVALNVKASSI
ncbi:hypothetical protein J6590_102236 [Homalodisca vitripennis]|nr:hypothetical protein J6590_102236 [Homalodisca vitripennis]